MDRSRTSSVVAMGAVLVAALSLLVSIRSCTLAERSLELSAADFEESRHFFWVAHVEDSDDALVLSLEPSNAEVRIVDARVTLPSDLVSADDLWPNGEQELRQTAEGIHQLVVPQFRQRLRIALEGNVMFRDGAFHSDNRPQGIPIGLASRYAVRGALGVDRSLYFLGYDYIAKLDPDQPPHYSVEQIRLGSLIYVGRIVNGCLVSDVIHDIWDQGGDHQLSISPSGAVLMHAVQASLR